MTESSYLGGHFLLCPSPHRLLSAQYFPQRGDGFSDETTREVLLEMLSLAGEGSNQVRDVCTALG